MSSKDPQEEKMDIDEDLQSEWDPIYLSLPQIQKQDPPNTALKPAYCQPDKTRSADSGTAGGAKSLAPLDSAKVYIRVDWTQQIPDRWKTHLLKALQRWFSVTLFNCVNEECSVLNLQLLDDPCHAVLEINPSRALYILKTLKKATLVFKDLKCSTTVYFLVDETKTLYEPQTSVPTVDEEKMPVSEVDMFFRAFLDLGKLHPNIQTELKRRFGNPQYGNGLSFSGNFDTIEKFYRDVCGITGGSETGMDAASMRNDLSRAEIPQQAEKSGAPPSFTIPLFHYWYFSRAFRNELSQFEEAYGVRINADVSVSVSDVDQTRNDSVQETAQRFIDLYYHSTKELQCVNIPQTQLESEIAKEVLRNVKIDQTKMVLDMSADQCLLFGPGQIISRFEKEMKLESRTASKTETDTSKSWTLEMDFEGTPDPIMMNETHYDRMKKISQRPIKNIEQKYGAVFSTAPSQGSIKDKTRSADSGTAGGAKSLAPLDSVKVYIRVDWTHQIPDRWKTHLLKALQRWFSVTLFNCVNEECSVLNLQLLEDPCHAVLEINSSRALDILKMLKKATLVFKDLKCSTTVYFLVDETKTLYEPQTSVPTVDEEKMPVSEVDMFFSAFLDFGKFHPNIQTELKRRFGNPQFGNSLFSGTFDKVKKLYRDVCGITRGSETGMAAASMRNDLSRAEIPQQAEKSGAPPSFTIPLFHYWYFSRAFRNELSQFEEAYGVRINADVSVSVSDVDQTRNDSVQETAQRFIDLYYHSTKELQRVNIPQTQLESEIAKEVLRNVKIDQTKMVLDMSADQCLLFGPGQIISRLEKEINNQGAAAAGRTHGPSLKSRTQANNDPGKVAKEKESVKSKDVDCTICTGNERCGAPPALTVPLSQYWYLSHAFRKELSQIENEFGVKINAEVSVSVTAVDQIRGNSVNKATQRVTDLVQNSMKSLQCAKIPHTQVESEILKEVVRNIPMDRAKMMINMSADQCLLFGPEPVISGVEEQMNLEPGVKLKRSSVCSVPGKLETHRDLRKAAGNAREKECVKSK